MLPPTKIRPSKRIRPFLTLRHPKHPWNQTAEKDRAKRLRETKRTQKAPCKEMIEQDLKQQNPQSLIPLKTNSPEIREKPLEQATTPKGFYLCPFCTCWFTQKKDLNQHMKKWCKGKKEQQ
jgi:hypothetical protein